MRNLLLHARFEESEQQSLPLNEQNMLLEEESRKRHDSEIRLRTLIETIPDLVWLKDSDGVYLACNPKFERVFDARETDIVGKTDYDFVEPELADFVRRYDKAAMAAGKPSMNEESVTYADDGHEELLETIKTPMWDSEGRLVGVLGIARDITEHKESEKSLRLAKEEADAANQAKSEFLSRMSHELRTPLNAVLGFSEMLERDLEQPLAPGQMKKVNEIRKAGTHLLALVDDVLDLSHIDSGQLEVSLTPVVCGELIQECLELVVGLAREPSVSVAFDEQEAAGKMVLTDRTRLKQVLVNLLSNAVKYNKPGGRVSIEVKEKGNGRMLLTVADTGPGIPPEWMGELFEPFRRLGAESRGVDGTGIGLTISKRLVELMGGRIGVESAPGEGSRFHVELPVPAGEAVLERDSDEEQDITPTERAAGAYGGRVLLVEDNPVNREVAVGMLEYLGCVVEVADEGESALHRFKEADYDLVLMDCEMPVMDGYQATREIRRLERYGKQSRIPVIALTAHAVQGSREKCLAAGMDEYISKPFTLAGLEAVLKHWLTLSH